MLFGSGQQREELAKSISDLNGCAQNGRRMSASLKHRSVQVAVWNHHFSVGFFDISKEPVK
ncbi:hypothetical protein [Methylomonas fluvii]|nr:hypothetical protein [Methylomonas fluvii]